MTPPAMTRGAIFPVCLPACLLAWVLLAGLAVAGPPPLAVTHYVSLRSDRAYLREGPSLQHRILWTYRHRGYPLAVTARFDVWRRVQDADGTVGWMNASILSDSRTVRVTGKGRAQIREKPDAGSKVIGLADPGAIAGLKACEKNACRIYADGIDGWIAKARVWGVDPGEVFR